MIHLPSPGEIDSTSTPMLYDFVESYVGVALIIIICG